MSAAKRIPGRAAAAAKGRLRAHAWLLARRTSQLGFLALFLSGPLAGLRIAEGTLAQSLTFGVLPLTDPLVFLQTLAAGHRPEVTAAIGAAIVAAAYALLRGRLYCSWVCPINPLTDGAAWLRRRLGLKDGMTLGRGTRFAVLIGLLVASALTGTVAWEVVNPITHLHRSIVFGALFTSAAWTVVTAVLVFDFAVAQRGWCGHLCPVGAFYRLLGPGLVRASAPRRERCDQCLDCYQVCPEPQVISPALKGPGGPEIRSAACTACGRCADVCPHSVFALGLRLPARTAGPRQGDPS